MNLQDKVLKIIGGNNKSEYSVKEFVTALNQIQQNEDSDLDLHVADTFLYDNGYEWENRRQLNEMCKLFLGKEIEKTMYDDEDESGPYGGAFRDEEDFWRWKEGPGFFK